nr:MAG TPA: hypothetical protein [Caudoviricetes sp.]
MITEKIRLTTINSRYRHQMDAYRKLTTFVFHF